MDATSKEAQAYLTYLQEQQDQVISHVKYMAPGFDETDWRYSVVLNGFVARLTYRQADRVRKLHDVRLVYPEEEFNEEMDGSRGVIGAPVAWQSGGSIATAGLGARVGILESGNAVKHPFLGDSDMPPAPAGYPLARYHLANGSSESFPQPAALTNNKMLAYRLFARNLTDEDRSVFSRGERVTAHGTHVAGIIGGRLGVYEIYPRWHSEMSGVAPMSTLFSYPVYGGTPELIAALEVAASEDKLDVMNISMGTATWLLDTPTSHPLALAAAGAEDAGMVIVTSAGNTGDLYPNSLTGSWKYSEHVLAVSSSTSAARSGVTITVGIEGSPAQLRTMRAGVFVPSSTSTRAPAIVIGDACTRQGDLKDKIAVVEMVTERNVINTYCGLNQSSQYLKDAGALAILYLYLGDLVGQHGLGDSAGAWSPVLPAYSLGYADSRALLDHLANRTESILAIGVDVQRSLDAPFDIMYSDASIGPGLNGSIKPDLSAPGVNIFSSIVRSPSDSAAQDSHAALWSEFSGTSMAAAHVSGAVALLRSRHPSWTAPQVRASLLLTSVATLRRGRPAALEPVAPEYGGVGRLDVGRAIDPGILLMPPKATFGSVLRGSEAEIVIASEGVSLEATRWKISVIPGVNQSSPISIDPEIITVSPGRVIQFSISFDSKKVTDTHVYGTVLLTEVEPPNVPYSLYLPSLEKPYGAMTMVTSASNELGPNSKQSNSHAHTRTGPPRSLQLTYSATIVDASEHRDVLFVDWSPDRDSSEGIAYIRALDSLRLSYQHWWMGKWRSGDSRPWNGDHPSLVEMRNFDLVIINTNQSQEPLGFPNHFLQYQYLNYLITGGNLVIAGQGSLNWWRGLHPFRVARNSRNELRLPETFPRVWNTPGEGYSCDICLTRYFAGFTPELTATLSARLLLPFGTRPDKPSALVLLRPHPDADSDSPFAHYSIDISTGNMAVGGAAGNQYAFASGDVMREYRPTAPDDPDTPVDESMLVANLGDVDDAAWTRVPGGRGRLIPDYARPLWSFPVNGQTKVVGTYIAGKHHPESDIPWNAMFWGFGLEGVGKSDDDTVTPEQLLGDTFNFLARNMRPQGYLMKDGAGRPTIRVTLGSTAAPLRFAKAEVDWTGGFPQLYTFDPPALIKDISLAPDSSVDPADLTTPISVTIYPVPGTAAPVHLRLNPAAPPPTP